MRHFFSTAFAVLLAIIGTGSKAQQTGEPPRAPQTMEQAEAQRQHADALRKEADRRYAADEAACYKKSWSTTASSTRDSDAPRRL